MFCWFPFVSITITVKMGGYVKAFMTAAEFMIERLPETSDYTSCRFAKARLYLCGP
jgi:hypothetical protein